MITYTEQWTTGDAVVYPEQWGTGVTVEDDYTLTTGDDGTTVTGNPGAGQTVGIKIPNASGSGFTGAGATITVSNDGVGDVEIFADSNVVLKGRPPGKGRYLLPNGNAPVDVIERALDRWDIEGDVAISPTPEATGQAIQFETIFAGSITFTALGDDEDET